jgi:hypothetical protein
VLAVALSDRRIKGPSSWRSDSLRARLRPDPRLRYETSAIVFRRLAEGVRMALTETFRGAYASLKGA